MTDPTNITRINATGNPLDDLDFLEETLDGTDWHAAIHYPDASPTSMQLALAAQKTLEKRGYTATPYVNHEGELLLNVHHLGTGTSLRQLWREEGVIGGTASMLRHPNVPMGAVGRFFGSKLRWLDASIHDPARFDGVINTTAEIVLFSASGGNQDSKMAAGNFVQKWLRAQKTSKNLMQTLATGFFMAQSIIYAFFAHTNDDIALNHLDKKLRRVEHIDGDIADLKFDAALDSRPKGFFHSISKFISKYPVQIGAVANDIGMLFYARHAFGERKWNRQIIAGTHPTVAHTQENIDHARQYNDGAFLKSGFSKDIASSITSFVAWSLLLLPRKPRTDEIRERDKDSPFAKTWDGFRENPQTVSGMMTGASSTFRLFSSRDKRNTLQTIGEGTYLLGDVALAFTKNDNYGGERTKNIDTLADKIADHINTIPHLFGPEAEHKFVINIAEYLKQKSLEEVNNQPEKKLNLTLSEIDERTEHLKRAVLRKVEGGNRLEKVVYCTTDLINLFPEDQRSAVREKVVDALYQLSWMEITPNELKTLVNKAPNAKEPPPEMDTGHVSLHAISKEVARILEVVPGIDTGSSAVALHNALLPFTRSNDNTPTTTVSHMVPSNTASLALAEPVR